MRVDVLEDAGKSLNPFLDVGQIEGAFVMGMGYFTSEEVVHSPETGAVLTNSSLVRNIKKKNIAYQFSNRNLVLPLESKILESFLL